MKHSIQIAGALDSEDAEVIICAGADEIALPVGPGLKTNELGDDQARVLFSFLRGQISTLAITYLTNAEEIARLLERVGTNRVQLHGEVGIGEIQKLRKRGTYFILKSFAVGQVSFEALKSTMDSFTAVVDGFLLDTYDPSDHSKGATGKTHDWNVSRRLVAASTKPIILAGGLDATNVSQAIRIVRPYGVDAHTRLETMDGRKDSARVRAFVEEARRAFEVLK